MAEKSRRFHKKHSLTVPEDLPEQSGEPIVAVPEPQLRLLNVQAKSGASYPLVLGDPAVTRKRRRA